MQQKKLIVAWEEFKSLTDLLPKEETLLKLAQSSLKNAYAPYSNFQVGAAILLENGVMVGGSNQENAAYPMCLCAERVALSAVASQYPNSIIKAMAITVKAPNQIIRQPAMPCGSCRQALCEKEYHQKEKIRLVIRGEEGPIYCFQSAKEILPFSFDASFL